MRSNYVFGVPCEPRGSKGPQTEVFHFTLDFLLYLIVLSIKVPCDLGQII